jgi:hypothetical protein
MIPQKYVHSQDYYALLILDIKSKDIHIRVKGIDPISISFWVSKLLNDYCNPNDLPPQKLDSDKFPNLSLIYSLNLSWLPRFNNQILACLSFTTGLQNFFHLTHSLFNLHFLAKIFDFVFPRIPLD